MGRLCGSICRELRQAKASSSFIHSNFQAVEPALPKAENMAMLNWLNKNAGRLRFVVGTHAIAS